MSNSVQVHRVHAQHFRYLSIKGTQTFLARIGSDHFLAMSCLSTSMVSSSSTSIPWKDQKGIVTCCYMRKSLALLSNMFRGSKLFKQELLTTFPGTKNAPLRFWLNCCPERQFTITSGMVVMSRELWPFTSKICLWHILHYWLILFGKLLLNWS